MDLHPGMDLATSMDENAGIDDNPGLEGGLRSGTAHVKRKKGLADRGWKGEGEAPCCERVNGAAN